MKEAMAAVTGADAGHVWVCKVIAHHQGAVDMTRIALEDIEDAGWLRRPSICRPATLVTLELGSKPTRRQPAHSRTQLQITRKGPERRWDGSRRVPQAIEN